jgi:hypothetical protein
MDKRRPCRISLRLLILAVCGLVTVRFAPAQNCATRLPPEDAWKLNEVSGVVLDPEGKEPVADAEVYAFFDGPSAGIQPITKSDGQGRYDLSNLQPGPYWIVAMKIEEGYPDPVDALHGLEWRSWIPKLKIHAYDKYGHVDVRLAPKVGKLVVRIFDADTKLPLKGAQWSIRREDDMEHASSGSSTWQAGHGILLLPPVPCEVMVKGCWYDHDADKVLETEEWREKLWIPAGTTQEQTLYLHVHACSTQDQ